MNAIGYTRLSQASDTSIESQKRHIREYAAEHGFDLVEIHDDGEHASGFDDARDGYQRVRECVERGDIDAVILNSKRRIARDVDEVMTLVPEFRRNGVELHTWQDGQLDLSDPVHAAIEIVQAASEHKAKQQEIERAKAAIREKQEKGHDLGRPRFGMKYNAEKTKQVPGEQFQDALEIIRMRRDGVGFREISEELDIGVGTAYRVWDRRQWYVERSQLGE